MIFHGTVVLIIGLLAGFPFLRGRLTPPRWRPRRAPHQAGRVRRAHTRTSPELPRAHSAPYDASRSENAWRP